MKKDILGVKIDDICLDDAVRTVENWLRKKGKHYIVTPNPEIVVACQKDHHLKKIINNADLAIPDGVGLRLAADIVCNTPGTDLMDALVKMANNRAFTTGFLGGRDGVAEKTSECLLKKYPKLKITFAESGGEVDEEGNMLRGAKRREVTLATDILFVAFGPPKQEKWIAKNLDKIPVKVAMGVGGAFDYLSGRVPRAPILLREVGLEWLFRLAVQPWRIKRQIALIRFLILILRNVS